MHRASALADLDAFEQAVVLAILEASHRKIASPCASTVIVQPDPAESAFRERGDEPVHCDQDSR
jgi:hypothetical protein